MLIKWALLPHWESLSAFSWPCDNVTHPTSHARLLHGMCVTLVLTLQSKRSVESNIPEQCCLRLHAVADKDATWVRPRHGILYGLSLSAESVFGPDKVTDMT